MVRWSFILGLHSVFLRRVVRTSVPFSLSVSDRQSLQINKIQLCHSEKEYPDLLFLCLFRPDRCDRGVLYIKPAVSSVFGIDNRGVCRDIGVQDESRQVESGRSTQRLA